MKKITTAITCFVIVNTMVSVPSYGQTWQSLGKMATVPVVSANTACNSAVDTVGITADRSSLLTCRSGVWTKQTANNGWACITFTWANVVGGPAATMADYGHATPNHAVGKLVGKGIYSGGLFTGSIHSPQNPGSGSKVFYCQSQLTNAQILTPQERCVSNVLENYAAYSYPQIEVNKLAITSANEC